MTLPQATQYLTPHRGREGNLDAIIEPSAIVLHHDGGQYFNSSVRWLMSTDSRVSYHILLGRCGEVAQFMPLNNRAWHAGTSEWHGKKWLNNWSVGISFVNLGRLTERSKGLYLTANGMMVKVPTEDVIQLKGVLYHKYTEHQLEVGQDIVYSTIKKIPKIKEVLTHKEVSPGRKDDPSDVFPLRMFRG